MDLQVDHCVSRPFSVLRCDAFSITVAGCMCVMQAVAQAMPLP